MPDTHHVTVTRESGSVVDRRRPYRVFVDDKNVFDIQEGERKQIAVSAGVHTLSLRIDWCRSQLITFEAGGGESMLWCWPNARPYTWPWFLTFGRARYIAASNRPREGRVPRKTLFRMYQVALLVALFAFILYEVISGRAIALVLLVPLAILAVAMRLLAAKGTKVEHGESGGET
jgi:hypothetical protein